MRQLLGILLVGVWSNAAAQTNGYPKPVTFTLQPQVSILVPGDLLFKGFNNKISVSHSLATGSATLLSSDGTLLPFSESFFVLNKISAQTVTLSLITTNNKKQRVILATKICQVVPYPVVKLSGVTSDSAVDCLTLAAGTFYAEFTPKRKIPVTKFKLDVYTNNTFVTDSVLGGRLSPSMIRYVSSLQQGAFLLFRDLEIDLGNGLKKIEPLFRIYLIKGEYIQTSTDL